MFFIFFFVFFVIFDKEQTEEQEEEEEKRITDARALYGQRYPLPHQLYIQVSSRSRWGSGPEGVDDLWFHTRQFSPSLTVPFFRPGASKLSLLHCKSYTLNSMMSLFSKISVHEKNQCTKISNEAATGRQKDKGFI